MIVYDLGCDAGHRFEGWFASRDAFAEQVRDGMVPCAVCGSTRVERLVTASRVAAKGNRTGDPAPSAPASATPPGAEAVRALVSAIAAHQAEQLPKSRWVGRDFAREARALHAADTPTGPIHGEATAAEAEALREEGIAALPLLVPVVPPERRH